MKWLNMEQSAYTSQPVQLGHDCPAIFAPMLTTLFTEHHSKVVSNWRIQPLFTRDPTDTLLRQSKTLLCHLVASLSPMLEVSTAQHVRHGGDENIRKTPN
ncbi:hypothetical protein AcV5_002800 [Taiwanofungus camphoratus]|nr:hypothetical protein AcV5_002800 [Antrodia cinnamomea]